MPNKWPLDQTIANDYEHTLRALTSDRFVSLRHAVRALTPDGSGTSGGQRPTVINIYGIIESVNAYNDSNKRVLVLDPSVQSAVTFIINNINHNIVIKNIVRLTNVSIVTSQTGKLFAVNQRKDFSQFYSFTYDYESTDPNQHNIFTANPADQWLDSDRPVARLLEQWFGRQFLKYNSFDKIFKPPVEPSIPYSPGGSEDITVRSPKRLLSRCIADNYIDFACLVMASQLLSQSILLTCYDGSEPSDSVVHNHMQVDYQLTSSELPTNRYHRLNTAQVLPNRVDARRLVFVNIWKNRSNQHNDHFEIAERTTLLNGDDLLVLFNVEIVRSPEDRSSVTLHLRSGRHYGKGVRKVHRNSVLGRLLMGLIRERELNLNHTVVSEPHDEQSIEELPIPQLSQPDDSLTEAIDDAIDAEMLSLGCRRLDALYGQQIREQDFRPTERTQYKYDLRLIERALQKSRDLIKFPVKPFTGFDGQCLQIKDLTSLTSNDTTSATEQSYQLILIRAKIVDLLPKGVFPVKQFVHVRCPRCRLAVTVKTYEQRAASYMTSDTIPSDECVDCGHQSTVETTDDLRPKLQYFYAIVFVIQDSSGDTTRVCLTRDNGLDVLIGGDGVDRVCHILNNSQCALRADNTLWRICDVSDTDNGLDWIIRKRDIGDTVIGGDTDPIVYEVVTVAPLNTFTSN